MRYKRIFFIVCILLCGCQGLPPGLRNRGRPQSNNLLKPAWTRPNGIRGGDLSTRGQFSYVVSIQRFDESICGGSLVDYQHVVTAAHCVIEKYSGEFSYGQPMVVASILDLEERKVFASRIKVSQVYVPAAYKPEDVDWDNNDRPKADIAVLKLEEPINIIQRNFVTKLKLPDGSIDYSDKNAIIVGYGWDEVKTERDPRTKAIIDEWGWSNGKLRFAKAAVLNNTYCSALMYTIRDTNLCAQVVQRNEENGEGACAGDSGGPLAYNNTLIGVLSASPVGCMEDEGSGIYTRVTSYLDFIQAALHDNVTTNMRTKIFEKEQYDDDDYY